LPTFTTSVGAGGSLEGPHAIFGTTNRTVPAVSMAIRSFIDKGIRHGRPLRALTTYNTWFSYGTFVDDASMRSEMALAASLGVEQFVVDAGWWAGIDPNDPSNFSQSWGNWTVDPDRFPDGLGALTDYAHSLGMRFGIWVEPERVDRATVPAVAQERFLATVDGRYDPGQPNSVVGSAQICLADLEARDWLLSKLYAFLDDVHPDYLKWDNNFWVNCNRPGHGHGTQDGNYQHMRQLENVFAALRDRYPDMDIENCASGGHRLSLEMLGYTDVGWVNDNSSPSRRVRHNLEGLTTLFPPGYLLTFAMADATETFDGSDQSDLKLVMRSRMAGVLGGTWTANTMGQDTLAGISEQNALFKLMRPVIQEGSTLLPVLQDGRSIMFDRQVSFSPDLPWSGWDAVEHILPRTGDVIILAFDTVDGPNSILVKPCALREDALYDASSADFGDLGTVSGSDLMHRGIQLDVSGVTHSHVIFLKIHRG
jgi:alpha-galactosidase